MPLLPSAFDALVAAIDSDASSLMIVPVALAGRSPYFLVTNMSFPATNAREFIALARARPGAINYSSSGSGSAVHLSMSLFMQITGIDVAHVPYKGLATAITEMMGGQLDLGFFDINLVQQHVQSGRLKALAVTSAKPSALFPGLPTVAASGLPGYECVAMYAVFVPAKTPQALVTRLNREIVKVLNTPEIREKFLAASTEIDATTPQGLADTMKSEMARMGKVIRAAGIRDD